MDVAKQPIVLVAYPDFYALDEWHNIAEVRPHEAWYLKQQLIVIIKKLLDNLSSKLTFDIFQNFFTKRTKCILLQTNV